jgi:hypothetical protein
MMTSSLSLSRDDIFAELRQVVLVGVADLLEEAMEAESLQQARDLAAVPAGEKSAQILILEATDIELAARDGAQQTVSFHTEDNGRVCADVYGKGEHAVVLAHGGRFNKESWRAQARALASKGF